MTAALDPAPHYSSTRNAWLALLLGCLALGLLSLAVLPKDIAYDPWSWLIWGREIAHIDLNTRHAATAVKPLPMVFTTILAPTKSWAPSLWLAVARGASLLAIAIAFRLAYTLRGAGAGVVAAVGLTVCNEYLGYLLLAGMSEPMATAAVLASADNFVRGRRGWGLFCLVLAALLRPEAWFFLFACCVWTAYRRSNRQRLAFALLAVGTPASWFIIDWFGSRQLNRSAGAAKVESQGGPLLSREPGLATARETWHLVSAPIEILFGLGLLFALISWARSRRLNPQLWIGLAALGWFLIAAAMAQGRFATGAPRYLLPTDGLACVVAGSFVSDIAQAVRSLVDRWRFVAAIAVLAVYAVVAASAIPRFVNTGHQVSQGLRTGRNAVHLTKKARLSIALAGGRAAVVACGSITTQNLQVPMVAWELDVPVGAVGIIATVPGIVFQVYRSPRVPANLTSSFHFVGAIGGSPSLGGRWTVLKAC